MIILLLLLLLLLVCGRPESYAMQGYPMPFHGENAALYRPSQIVTGYSLLLLELLLQLLLLLLLLLLPLLLLFNMSELIHITIFIVMEDIHQLDGELWSALHNACATGNAAIVKELLR